MEKSVHTKEYRALRAALRTMRESADLSQRDLATKLKVPPSWVAKVEAGERRLDLIEFCWFAQACGQAPTNVLARLLATKPPKSTSGGGKR